MSANVLAQRDANQQLGQSVDDGKPKSLEYHRQMLESRLKSGQIDEQKYVSPSDGIQSPATQKLAAFKNKHGLQKSKPKTLFGKMSARNMENAANGGAMFADIPQKKIQTASTQSS
ncbi:hypothetical protein DIS24_g1984 [Lasiodiplodia hormozganensis]|uniref:Protein BNS1 n=2 Tax=Lasiodiplodia TaxID=66739 RepID=A0A5N5DI33_9PEZI|nr:hypothetical protein DBV05_g4357 [Lasiodiplodia theobromae]KAK0662227.1 hypothetical protein DIS24_g1984 [Lasiodiplodia hormozganensis]